MSKGASSFKLVLIHFSFLILILGLYVLLAIAANKSNTQYPILYLIGYLMCSWNLSFLYREKINQIKEDNKKSNNIS